MLSRDESFMAEALMLAQESASEGEVPVGAVVVHQGSIIARGRNQPIGRCDPSAHAEMVAIRNAAQYLSNYRLVDCELFVTLEPCTMCAGVLVHSRIGRLVFGAQEPKAGVIVSNQRLLEAPYFNHQIDVVGGVLAEQSAELLGDFFKLRRTQKKALKRNGSEPL